MAGAQQQLADEIGNQFATRSRRMALASFLTKALIAAAAAIVTYLQIAGLPPGQLPFLSSLGIGATALAFLGTIFLIFLDQDVSLALETARKATDELRKVDEALQDLESVRTSLDRSAQLYQALMAMRGAIEHISNNHPVDEKELAEALLTVSKRNLLNAMGFTHREHWTIGIYRAETNRSSQKTGLRLLAHERTVMCELDKARVWPEGVGAAGMAYAGGSEVIVPDTRATELGTIFEQANYKATDLNLYRSIVAVPVLIGAENRKWGVCIATSDVQGHFAPDRSQGVQAAEAIRALAGMLALAISVQHAPRDSSTESAPNTTASSLATADDATHGSALRNLEDK